MVSIMESNDVRAQLHALERAEAAPYVDQRPSPWWFAPAFGAWFGVMAAVQDFHWSHDVSSMWQALVTLAILVPMAALIGAYTSWHQRYHGAWPKLVGPKPPEIRRVYRLYFLAFVVVAAALVGVALLVPWWVTGAVTAVVAYGFLVAYERVYERAAAAVRERLA
ncbi:hypothetical protein GCM10027215_39460 [Nocardioides zeae]